MFVSTRVLVTRYYSTLNYHVVFTGTLSLFLSLSFSLSHILSLSCVRTFTRAERHRLRHTIVRPATKGCIEPIFGHSVNEHLAKPKETRVRLSANIEGLSNFTSIRSPIVKSFVQHTRAGDVRSSLALFLLPAAVYHPLLRSSTLSSLMPDVSPFHPPYYFRIISHSIPPAFYQTYISVRVSTRSTFHPSILSPSRGLGRHTLCASRV